MFILAPSSPPKTKLKMPQEEPSETGKEFVRQALEKNIRIDGRSFEEHRELSLSFGQTEFGVAEVMLGKTRFACSILGENQGNIRK